MNSDNYYVRMYYIEKKVLYEIVDSRDSSNNESFSFKTGYPLIDFTFCDLSAGIALLEKAFKFENKDELPPSLKEALKSNHIYFYLFYILESPNSDYVAYFTNLQKDIKNYVYWCLDLDVNKDFSNRQRLTEFINHSSFNNLILDSFNINLEPSSIDHSLEPSWVFTIYPNRLITLVTYSMIYLIEKKTWCRQCQSCGRYFILGKFQFSTYCNRIMPNSKLTCKQVGATTVYRAKKKDDKALAIYNKYYKRYYARLGFGKMTREEFQIWSKAARAKRNMCQKGNITLDEFKQWLEKN